jgi:hypothetical protein
MHRVAALNSPVTIYVAQLHYLCGAVILLVAAAVTAVVAAAVAAAVAEHPQPISLVVKLLLHIITSEHDRKKL